MCLGLQGHIWTDKEKLLVSDGIMLCPNQARFKCTFPISVLKNLEKTFSKYEHNFHTILTQKMRYCSKRTSCVEILLT